MKILRNVQAIPIIKFNTTKRTNIVLFEITNGGTFIHSSNYESIIIVFN